MPTENDEKLLLMQIAESNEVAFETLFHKYRDKLYFFILQITNSQQTAEDVLQEVFVKLWLNRSTLFQINNFNAYIYQIARHHVLNGLRRMALETSILSELQRKNLNFEIPADEILLDKQLQEKLTEIIQNLPPQQKAVYVLSRQQGLKNLEIANRLNLSISTVKNHLTQALNTIRKKITQHQAVTSLYAALVIKIFF